MTLRQLIADYLHYRGALGYRLVRDSQILSAFGHRFELLPLRAISADRVLGFLCLEHICYDTVARRHRALRGFYRYVQARHGALLPTLPDLPNGHTSNFTPYVYSHAELKRLLRTTPAACSNPLGQVDAQMLRTLILLLYGAGLRLGEALALKLSDLDLEQSFLSVRQSKFYKSRLVPFGEDLTRVLRQYSRRRDRRYPNDPDSPVFRLRNGRRAHHKIIERTFRRLCLMAAVRREGGSRRQPRLHDLRHTAAVHRLIHWYRSGADLQRLLPRLATYLGHKDLSGTQRYLTLTPPLLREASRRFQRYVGDRSHD
jgi:site-specific recombinase XerD